MLRLAVLVVLLTTNVNAFELHVRDDDAGAVHVVDDIIVEKTLDWNDGPVQWAKEFEDVHYGQLLHGMGMECIDAPNNPSQWTRGAFRQNGKLTGEPTAPLTITSGINNGHVFLYSSTSRSRELVALTRFGCGDWGDSPFSIIFDVPRTAFSLTVGFNRLERICNVGERWHIQGFDQFGLQVMHQDVISIDAATECILTVRFASDAPVAAISTWVQNGPGVSWHRIDLGSVADIPLTLKERVERLEEFHPE